MQELQDLIRQVVSDRDLTPEQVPALDLYMDQVLTLFNDGLRDSKRHPEDKLLTKTMINNYSKEKLLSPIKGKKYSHQHIMQMLCVYQLKQTLALGDVKQLTGRDDVDFEACWRQFLTVKEDLRTFIPEQLAEKMPANLDDPSARLTLCLALSAVSSYMRRLCEAIIDSAAEK
ncbi:MAG: DUF1836 domain-containing protein [Butyricicoccus pullicaecorum]|jgi:hypothetical protein|nr:DUF1836 domain-containing protein [Butyricicoccus pullicaecorum]